MENCERDVLPVPVIVGTRSSAASRRDARALVRRDWAMRTSRFARCASRTSIVRVVSPSSFQIGASAAVALTVTLRDEPASIVAAGCALVVAVGTVPTLYDAGTGTSDARYAGVPHAASNALNPMKILRMGVALVSSHERWSPWIERFDVGRSLDRLAGGRNRSLDAPVHISAHQHIKERREEQAKEGHTEHS